jgi:GNAT superfamily N-acetyltransferase
MSTIVRAGKVSDVAAIYRHIGQFHQESPKYSKFPLVEDRMREFLVRAVLKDRACVYVAENADEGIVGVIVGVVEKQFFSDYLILSDAFWYVAPRHRSTGVGKKMIAPFIAFGESMKCGDILIGTTTNILPERTGAALEKLGFSMLGTVYSYGGGE